MKRYDVNTFWVGDAQIGFKCPFCRYKRRTKFTDIPLLHTHGHRDEILPITRAKHCELEDIPIGVVEGDNWEFNLLHPTGCGKLIEF